MVSLRRKTRPVPAKATRLSRATRRADLSGLDVEPDLEDDEYEEQQLDVEPEDDFQISDDEEEESVRRSTRKRRAEVLNDDSEDGEAEGEDAEDTKVKADGDADGDAEVEEEGEGDEEEEGDEAEAAEQAEGDDSGSVGVEKEKAVVGNKINRKPRPKKRGRKKLKVIVLEEGTFDEEGNPLQVEDDEVVIANEDEAGKLKIDRYGNLQDGREFRNRTFKLCNGDQKLYMISTEPARLVGFRDSYLLFKTHRALFKKTCTNEEKNDLINRGILPNSYKSRSVNLVTARSIYREFGAKIIKDGKKVIDDFWEQRAIENGDVAGEYADPQELFNRNRYGNLFEANTTGGSTPLAGKAIVNYQSDPTWLFQIASQTNDYNKRLYEQRNATIPHGIKDPFTNLMFIPSITQPTKASIKKIADSDESIVFETVFTKPSSRKVSGLRKVSKEIFEDIEDKSEIIAQQKFEQNV